MRMRVVILFSVVASVLSQFTSQTYPDPRLDPISCRVTFASPICDPSGVLTDEERTNLHQRVNQLHTVTAGIRNTSPACALNPDKNLDVIVAVIDKIGVIPSAPVDIEKFANNLKRRYQNFQDVGVCDTMVLIVNSRQDRQSNKLFFLMIKFAFNRNIGYFKSGQYALGLEGMIEIVVAAYSNSHIVQVPSPELYKPEAIIPTSEPIVPFRAAGLPNSVQPVKINSKFTSTEEIDEKDKVWVSIMQQAVARCGSQLEDLPFHVRAVVEDPSNEHQALFFLKFTEAMSISLQLISDSRYNSIEEEVEGHKDVIGIREKACFAGILALRSAYFFSNLYIKNVGNCFARAEDQETASCCNILGEILQMCGLCCYITCPPLPEIITRKLAFHPPKKGLTYTVHLKELPEKKIQSIEELIGQEFDIKPKRMSPAITLDYEQTMKYVKPFIVRTSYGNHLICVKCTPRRVTTIEEFKNQAITIQIFVINRKNSCLGKLVCENASSNGRMKYHLYLVLRFFRSFVKQKIPHYTILKRNFYSLLIYIYIYIAIILINEEAISIPRVPVVLYQRNLQGT
uniref:Inositol-pentakisphosphate 2-kinase n=1 Tax=Heterorhabditis bacteriophora TaxID=37862 RepID=A0A1I7WWM9_HETBA